MKFVGDKSLSHFMKLFLMIIMVITIAVIVFLPWIVDHYLIVMYDGVSSYAKTMLLIMLYPCGVCGLLIENELRKMFMSLEKKNPFVIENVKSLNRMGILMLIILVMFIFKVITLNTIMTMLTCFAIVIISILCFVLADVINQAVIYKQENDLTI